jgi:phospholipid/cholesterol/gamma-HCH transport system substrate-binding protein
LNRTQTDIAVGLFVLVAFAVLMWGSVQVGAIRGWTGTEARRIVARFEDVSGLDEESEVLVAGVRVGRVERMELEGGQARVTIRVENDDLVVPVDSVVAIRSRGLLGEKVVEIVPGRSDLRIEDDGALASTQEATDLGQLVNRLGAIATDIEQVSDTFRRVLGGPEGEASLREIVSNVQTTTSDLRALVERNEERVDRAFSNFDSFSSELAQLTAENRDSISELVSSYSDASTKLNTALDSLVRVSEQVERGEGTLGKLLSDDELYQEVDAALVEARGALREVRRAAEETQEQVPATILTVLIGSLF